MTLFAADAADTADNDDDDGAAAAAGGEDRSLNAEIVAEGWATVAGKGKGRAWEVGREDVLRVLRGKEVEARVGRRGVWEYGDLTED